MQLAGLINVAKEVRGLQLSVINIADTIASGMQFGIFNIVLKNGLFSPTLESSEINPLQVSLKMGLEKCYSIYAVGTNPDQYWTNTVGFGSKRFVSAKRKIFLNPELRYISFFNDKSEEDEDSNVVRLNLNVGYQLSKRRSISGGPSLNFFFTDYLDENNDPVLDLNDAFLLNRFGSGFRYQLWIGYSIALSL